MQALVHTGMNTHVLCITDSAEDVNCNSKQNGHPTMHKKEDSRTLYIVFVALVLDLLAFTMILPLLPSILDYYGQQEVPSLSPTNNSDSVLCNSTCICDIWPFQDSLYQVLQNGVHGFRQLVGAPDTPKWNSVLFGGQFLTSWFFSPLLVHESWFTNHPFRFDWVALLLPPIPRFSSNWGCIRCLRSSTCHAPICR